jgi:hypothetical protein
MSGRLTSLFRKFRSSNPRTTPRSVRPQVEALEDRYCPTSLFAAGFWPGTAILNISNYFSTGGGSLWITGNTGPGGGPSSTITVIGGFATAVNGMNAASFSTLFPGSFAQINLSLLGGGQAFTLGTPAGIVNLPGTTLNITVG